MPQIELLKLQRSLNDIQRDLNSAELQIPVIASSIQEAIFKYVDIALKFRSDSQKELNDVSNRLAALTETSVGLKDRVNRTTVTSPVTGTIQKLYVNTVGGVIQPGMPLIEIVPTEDTLLIEAKIAPQDIGFLRPELKAIVKFSAYDFTSYGGLDGTVETISADTIQDEEGNSFYQVRIRTETSSLKGMNDEPLPIIPGMTAQWISSRANAPSWTIYLNPYSRRAYGFKRVINDESESQNHQTGAGHRTANSGAALLCAISGGSCESYAGNPSGNSQRLQ